MLIPLDRLQAHPANANVMPEALLAKLEAHLRETGQCPHLIVRELPGDAAGQTRYQILDGHHRALVLRRLGWPAAECDVWPDVDDRRAALLLLTLNRLHGEDDPHRRGDLLALLSRELDPQRMAELLPESSERIERLIALTQRPMESIEEPDIEALPQALTFFLSSEDRRAVLAALRGVGADRNRALVLALCSHRAGAETAAHEKAPQERGASGACL